MQIENSLQSKNLSKIQKIFANREKYFVTWHLRPAVEGFGKKRIAASLLSSQHGGFLRGAWWWGQSTGFALNVFKNRKQYTLESNLCNHNFFFFVLLTDWAPYGLNHWSLDYWTIFFGLFLDNLWTFFNSWIARMRKSEL